LSSVITTASIVPPSALGDLHDHIVRQGPLWFLGHLHAAIDTGRLKEPNQNGKLTFPIALFQIDDLVVTDFADNDAGKLHWDRHMTSRPGDNGHGLRIRTRPPIRQI
jgi:hypothetical protein